MEYTSKEVLLKNGRICVLRRPEEDDAEMLLALMKSVCGETRYMVLEPEEITTTAEREREILRTNRSAERSLFLSAFIGGKLMGVCSFGPAGKRNRTLHRCTAAISVDRDCRGLGVGTALMAEILRYAKTAGFEQMELEVVSGNAPAIGLYKKMGFEVFGTVPCALKYGDGTYEDFLFMVKKL